MLKLGGKVADYFKTAMIFEFYIMRETSWAGDKVSPSVEELLYEVRNIIKKLLILEVHLLEIRKQRCSTSFYTTNKVSVSLKLSMLLRKLHVVMSKYYKE